MKHLLRFQKHHIRNFNDRYFSSKRSYRTIERHITYEVSNYEIRNKFIRLFMIVNQRNDQLHHESYIFEKTRIKIVIRNNYRQKVKFNSHRQI